LLDEDAGNAAPAKVDRQGEPHRPRANDKHGRTQHSGSPHSISFYFFAPLKYRKSGGG
jgi:hypothetical protein